MKRFFYWTLPALVLAFAVYFVATTARTFVQHPTPVLQEDDGDDSPGALGEWELLRQRDPATGKLPIGIHRSELEFSATIPAKEPGLYKGSGLAEYSWAPRGPFNIGGRTRALALDITGEDTILAGGASGGMWRSVNGGATWNRTTSLAQNPAITTIAQDIRPGKTNIWYYGTGELVGGSASTGGAFFLGDGVFKSVDNGLTWSVLSATRSGTPQSFENVFDVAWRLATNPANLTQDEVYEATYGTIKHSTNGGTKWSNALGGPDTSGNYSGRYADVAVSKTGVVYATMSSDGWKKGIWRSTDGKIWTNITPAHFPKNYNRIVVGIAPSNENSVYFLAETPGFGKLGRNFQGDSVWSSLWKYTYLTDTLSDPNAAWEDRSSNLPITGTSFGDFNSQTSYDLHVTVDPTDENLVLIGGTNLYRSTDGFATLTNTKWIGGYQNIPLDSNLILNLEYPNHHPDQHAAVFSVTQPGRVYTGSDGGVHRTDNIMADSVVWNTLDNGYLTSQFYTIALDHGTPGDVNVAGGLQDNGSWMSTQNSPLVNWKRIGTGDGAYCQMADGKSAFYISKQLGKTYRATIDGSGLITSSTRIDPLGGKNYLFINSFVLDPSNNNSMFLAGGSYLWRNTALSSIPLNSTLAATSAWARLDSTVLPDSVAISAIAVSTSNPQHRVYYGTDYGKVFRIDAADQGQPVPTSITPTTFPKNGYVSCIAVDPNNADSVIVVFSNYNVQSVFLSTNGGTTWAPISGNLEQNAITGTGNGPSCRWLSILHRDNGTLYFIGTSTGLYSTSKLNGTATVWLHEGTTNVGNAVVDMIDVRQSDGYVAIGTHGVGVFTTTVQTVGVPGDATYASTTTLDQNVPNPIQSMASIHFSLANSGHATLRLYDERGRLAATLFDGIATKGDHEVSINPDDATHPLASGTYFYELRVGRTHLTRKLEIERQ